MKTECNRKGVCPSIQWPIFVQCLSMCVCISKLIHTPGASSTLRNLSALQCYLCSADIVIPFVGLFVFDATAFLLLISFLNHSSLSQQENALRHQVWLNHCNAKLHLISHFCKFCCVRKALFRPLSVTDKLCSKQFGASGTRPA